MAQESMKLEEAIAIAIENNFDIKLAVNAEQLAKNSQTIYNSGFLPNVTANGNANYSNSNTTFTTQQGVENSIDGAEIQSFGSSIGINYLLFNGGARKFQYDKLKQQFALSSVQKQLQIENTLMEVYIAYFEISRNQEQRDVLSRTYQISKDRLTRVIAQQKFGQKTNLDVLNAQVDANTDSMNLMKIEMNLLNLKRNLNFLLGRAVDQKFSVDTAVVLDRALDFEKLKSDMASNNVQLQQVALNKKMSAFDVNITKAGWIPTVSASASYGLNYSDNGRVGFFQNQQSAGLSSGINLSWDIFDGGRTMVQVQNSKISLEKEALTEERTKLALDNQLAAFWLDYQLQKRLIENERTNIEVSNQNFLKSKELFHLGQASSLDFREAQLNQMRTKLNLINATFDAKIAELQLKRFAGTLI
jgi:outer membrane protein TolC